ncbi:MAG: succinylglutamate desuccinylase/aspartoacylase family protein [Bacilli bacterium]
MLIAGLVGCTQPVSDPVEVEIDHSEMTIMTGTIYETEVHTFVTNVDGPRVVIVGGIHGDEIAGWTAGLELLEFDYKKGSYLIIPQASILACQLGKRYPGQGNNGQYNEVTYEDLNRVFPGSASGSATGMLAYAIISAVSDFNPDVIIDLHESKDSYTNGYLGDSVIYGNVKTALFALEMTEEMNANHITATDTPFHAENSAPEGSFNHYCGQTFDALVMTFETNRKLDFSRRFDQQMDLIQILFNKI